MPSPVTDTAMQSAPPTGPVRAPVAGSTRRSTEPRPEATTYWAPSTGCSASIGPVASHASTKPMPSVWLLLSWAKLGSLLGFWTVRSRCA